MRLLEIDGYLINPEQISYIFIWGATRIDVHFAGRKKPIEVDKDEFLALLRKNSLLEYKRTKPQERPEILSIEQGTRPGYNGLCGTGIQPRRVLDLLAGEEADEREESAG